MASKNNSTSFLSIKDAFQVISNYKPTDKTVEQSNTCLVFMIDQELKKYKKIKDDTIIYVDGDNKKGFAICLGDYYTRFADETYKILTEGRVPLFTVAQYRAFPKIHVEKFWEQWCEFITDCKNSTDYESIRRHEDLMGINKDIEGNFRYHEAQIERYLERILDRNLQRNKQLEDRYFKICRHWVV